MATSSAKISPFHIVPWYSFSVGIMSLSYRDPDDRNNHIQSLVITSLVLEAPHSIRLLVPVCSCRRMHASSAYVWLSICRGRLGAAGIGFRLDCGRLDGLGLV